MVGAECFEMTETASFHIFKTNHRIEGATNKECGHAIEREDKVRWKTMKMKMMLMVRTMIKMMMVIVMAMTMK